MQPAKGLDVALQQILGEVTEGSNEVENGPQYVIDQLIKKYPEHTLNTHVEPGKHVKSKIFKYILTSAVLSKSCEF